MEDLFEEKAVDETEELDEIDAFADDETEENGEGNGKGGRFSKKQKIILIVAAAILAVLLVLAGIFAFVILKNPKSLFDTAAVGATATAEATPAFDIGKYLPTQEPGATPIPGSEEEQGTETIELPNIVNIALFGIDAFESGKTTSGSMPHTDVNMVLAINFDTKQVSLISLARDCMTTAPGITGIYKFNGIFNAGGGMKDPHAGFELSKRALEEWFGGVSIPYYYGLDFQAVIDLVDSIGGIDFDLDIEIRTFDGKKIGKGMRHLNGQGVMAYLRMRRTVTGGLDSNRTARQRKMLVAIFRKLKEENLLSKVPELLQIMGDDVYTNTTIAQTTALVNFASEIDADSIKTYSIQGTMSCRYEWRYCFIDQQNRIDILREVYGIEAKPIGLNSETYETFLHKSGFEAMKHLNIAKKIFAAVHDNVDEASMTEDQKTIYATCWKDYTDLQTLFKAVSDWTAARYQGNALSAEEQKQRDAYYEALKEQEQKLHESGDALNNAFGKRLIKANWKQGVKYWSEKDSDVNEVYVDFR